MNHAELLREHAALQHRERESEALFRAIFDGAVDAILIADDDGEYVDANAAACELFGLAKEQLLGRRVESSCGTFPLRRRDGTVRIVEARAVENMLPGRHLSILRDVTKRERAEQQLRMVISNAPLILFAADAEGTYTLHEGKALEILGLRPGQLVGQSIIGRQEAPERAEALRRALAGERTTGEFEHRGRTFDCVVIPVRGEDGDVTGITGVAIDVTERKALENRLRAEAERNRLLFEASPQPMWLVDVATLRFLDVNQAAIARYGYTREELLALTLDAISTTTEHGERSARHRTKRGEILDVEITSHELDFRGRRAVLSVVVDVTQLRRTEEQLRQAAKMEAIGTLAGGVAHDFNNLLTVILSYTSVLEEEPLDDFHRDAVREIHQAGERAASLTRQLLAFGRKQTLRPTVLDVNEVVRNMRDMLARIVGDHVELSVLDTDTPAKVHVDRTQLEQVLMNLVVNARDAMPAGGRVVVETAFAAVGTDREGLARGTYVLVAVSDNGVGIDEDTRSRIFEPFFTTKEQGKGTGLGLATVYGIVRQSGGAVFVESTPGKGTRFEVYIPLTELDAEAPPASSAEPTTLRGTETILLVEDSPPVRAIAAAILRKNGYEVLEAENAGEALILAEQTASPIHLLLTDVVMPRISGPQLAERLTKLRPDLRVLYISGHADDASARTDLVSKPIVPDTLLRRVRVALD